MLNECFKAYEAGAYSPKFLNPDQIEPGTIVVNEEDDMKRLAFARMQVKGGGKKVEVRMKTDTANTSDYKRVVFRTSSPKKNFSSRKKLEKAWTPTKLNSPSNKPWTIKCIFGPISIARENRDTLTESTQDLSGISTTKRIMIWIILRRKSCKDTNLIFFIRIWSISTEHRSIFW